MQVTHVNSTLSLTWNKIDDYLLPNIWVNQSFGLGLSGIDQAPYSLPPCPYETHAFTAID